MGIFMVYAVDAFEDRRLDSGRSLMEGRSLAGSSYLGSSQSSQYERQPSREELIEMLEESRGYPELKMQRGSYDGGAPGGGYNALEGTPKVSMVEAASSSYSGK